MKIDKVDLIHMLDKHKRNHFCSINRLEHNSLDYDNVCKLYVVVDTVYIHFDVSLSNCSSRCNDSIESIDHVQILDKNFVGL